MPKRTDINSILIIGAGPIVIGQACEFDYSGAQACTALREEGYRIILVNSNPATIMTDPEMADVTYIEPITWTVLEKIIERERPDALLPTMGGQTALNCALDLARNGVLERFDVELIGASRDAIDKAEDREKFKQAMTRIGLDSPRSSIAHSMEEALQVQAVMGFPTIIRPSFTMGGTGGGIAYNRAEFIEICERGLEASPTRELLIEESLIGWKEYEMEVVRDRKDNCIIVCSIENLDPMGVHTGDSITVAPSQTLTDREYQLMRNASIAVLREIGVETGGSNVQFGINPADGRMVVIEMNPRVSRSSALASKATGFPIAKVAARLAVGYTLDELTNDITGGVTPASFEPSIDYVVTKIPRFAFEKFPLANDRLTTQMKSVGEVMAIGRTFRESLQKALRGLETGRDGLDPLTRERSVIEAEIGNPGPERLWYVADAFRIGMSLEEVYEFTRIDLWFLVQIQALVADEAALAGRSLESLDAATLLNYKRNGFSDRRLATLLGSDKHSVRERRWAMGVHPVFKRVDTCAAEFASHTAYMYSTYEEECEARPTDRRKIMVLGGGPNRIGQGIEFDYCCVHAALALREDGFETIMVNCNPETVSTDYDTSDRLYFEPLTSEDLAAVIASERAASRGDAQLVGVIVSLGGQTPLKLAAGLEPDLVLGTSPASIDLAEDRERWNELCRQLGIAQPPGGTAVTAAEALEVARGIGYPVLVRPSYVLGGRAMEIVYDDDRLVEAVDAMAGALHREGGVTADRPVLVDRFLEDAVEVDVDAIRDADGEVLICGVMEHVEEAGVHSGDSACALPPQTLAPAVVHELEEIVRTIAAALEVKGLCNVQFAVKDDKVYVLEANPRASRTVPFVAKATGVPVAMVAARVVVGATLAELRAEGLLTEPTSSEHVAVKEAVLPFNRFPGVDTILGPEMRSTGEVMGIDATFGLAFAKSQIAAGSRLPTSGTVFFSLADRDKPAGIDVAQRFAALGFEVVATSGTAAALEQSGVKVADVVAKVGAGAGADAVELIAGGKVQLVVNTPRGRGPRADGLHIRAAALEHQVPCLTTVAAARAAAAGIADWMRHPLSVRSLQEYHHQGPHQRGPHQQ